MNCRNLNHELLTSEKKTWQRHQSMNIYPDGYCEREVRDTLVSHPLFVLLLGEHELLEEAARLLRQQWTSERL